MTKRVDHEGTGPEGRDTMSVTTVPVEDLELSDMIAVTEFPTTVYFPPGTVRGEVRILGKQVYVYCYRYWLPKWLHWMHKHIKGIVSVDLGEPRDL